MESSQTIRKIQQQLTEKGHKAQKRSFLNSESFWAYIMIFPTFFGLGALYIWPVFQTVYFSFTKWETFGDHHWVGLTNYKQFFTDPAILHALRNTLVYIVLTIPPSIAISIFFAVLLNQKIRGIALYRTLYYLPSVTMPAATAMVWKWLYNSDYGLINYVLGLFSISGPAWLTDPNTALYAIIILSIWGSIGGSMVIYLAGLQSISRTFYEAAEIDGANARVKFFRITLPLLTPTIFFSVVMGLMGAFQIFDVIFLMVGPTAQESAQTLVFLYYQNGFVYFLKGYASAIAVVLLMIILLVTALQMKLQKKWVHYE